MSIEAMKLALDVLENTSPLGFNMESDKKFYASITALRQAVEQSEQSVATNDTSPKRVDETQKQRHDTTPEQRQWVGLTYEEIDQCLHPSNDEDQLSDRFWDGVDWAKSQIKEKNK